MALISNVVTGGTITATWGNAIRDTTVQITTSSARPTSPAEGMMIYETDTDRLLIYNGSSWVRFGQSASTGRTGCTVRNTTSTGVGNGALYAPTFNTSDYDSDSFCSTPSGTITVPTGLGGLYSIAFSIQFAGVSGFPIGAGIKVSTNSTAWGYNGGLQSMGNATPVTSAGVTYSGGIATIMPLNAGDTLTFTGSQTSGGTISATAARADVYRIGL